jgi:ABC-type polysaccharide/polyol phosphate export permease
MAVQAVVFANFFGTSLPHYPVYLLSGTLVFTLFSQSTVAAMGNLISNGSTLRRMYVPPSVFVASSIGSAVVNFGFALIPLVLVAIVFQAPISLAWFYILAVSAQTMLFATGVALILAASMVFFNDTSEIYLVFIAAYNFLTPIFYPLSLLPPWLRQLERYNPMFLYVSGAQRAFTLGVLPDLSTQTVGWIIAGVSIIAGWLLFTSLEDRFAYHF